MHTGGVVARRLINQMWILKNSKELLNNLNSNSLASVHSIKTYDFSTLYTTIPHSKLKSRLTELIRNAFRFKMVRNAMNILLLATNLHILLRTTLRLNISTQRTTLLEC